VAYRDRASKCIGTRMKVKVVSVISKMSTTGAQTGIGFAISHFLKPPLHVGSLHARMSVIIP
jgi:hypothetical protein